VPIAFGVVLVALPTAYTIFPEWGSDARTEWRLGILALWLVVAVVGAWLTTSGDSRLHTLVRQEAAQRDRAQRRAAITVQFQNILVPGVAGIPVQYQFTVYGPSPDGRFLIPLLPPALNSNDTAIFPVGAGATGKAWESRDGAFVVVGEAVSTAEHGLTPAQRRRYGSYGAVAATVMLDENDEPVGVLTAIAREDDGFFTDETGVGVAALRSVADAVGWLMPEAVVWLMPTGEDVPHDP